MMPNDDPGVEVAKHAFGYTTDCAFRFLRFLLISVALTALIFSFLTLTSCQLAVYDLPPIQEDENETLPELDNSLPEVLFEEEDPKGTLGLYKYNPDGFGCQDWSPTGDELKYGIRVSRAGGLLGVIFGCLAFLLLLIEFLCCRFCCSRIFIVFSLLAASICQLFTFFIFLDETCQAEGEYAYLCKLDSGSIFSLVSSGLYFLAAILTCPTPKAIPLVYVLREMERNSVVDPVCCFRGRTSEEILEVNTELAELIERPDEEVKLDGVTYQQYYESGAGVTLQDQYCAAYQRWVACEEDYNKTLDRLKSECAETEASWRQVRKQDPADVEDDELQRLVVLLNIQRQKSEIARLKMERFQADLDLVMTTPEEAEAVDEEILENEPPKVVPWWRLRWRMPWMKKDNKDDSDGEVDGENDVIKKSSSVENSDKSEATEEVGATGTKVSASSSLNDSEDAFEIESNVKKEHDVVDATDDMVPSMA